MPDTLGTAPEACRRAAVVAGVLLRAHLELSSVILSKDQGCTTRATAVFPGLAPAPLEVAEDG